MLLFGNTQFQKLFPEAKLINPEVFANHIPFDYQQKVVKYLGKLNDWLLKNEEKVEKINDVLNKIKDKTFLSGTHLKISAFNIVASLHLVALLFLVFNVFYGYYVLYAYSSNDNLIQLAEKVKEFDNKIKIYFQNDDEANIDYYFLEGIVEEGDNIYQEILSELKEIEEKKNIFEYRQNWARFGVVISFVLILTSAGLALSTGSAILKSAFWGTEILSFHQMTSLDQEIAKIKNEIENLNKLKIQHMNIIITIVVDVFSN